MNFHRKQSDGSLRDSDNWQKALWGKSFCGLYEKFTPPLYGHMAGT